MVTHIQNSEQTKLGGRGNSEGGEERTERRRKRKEMKINPKRKKQLLKNTNHRTVYRSVINKI